MNIFQSIQKIFRKSDYSLKKSISVSLVDLMLSRRFLINSQPILREHVLRFCRKNFKQRLP